MHQVQHSFFKCIYISLKSLSVSFLSFSNFFRPSLCCGLMIVGVWGKSLIFQSFTAALTSFFFPCPPPLPQRLPTTYSPARCLLMAPWLLNSDLLSLSSLPPPQALSYLHEFHSSKESCFFLHNIYFKT